MQDCLQCLMEGFQARLLCPDREKSPRILRVPEELMSHAEEGEMNASEGCVWRGGTGPLPAEQ